MTRNSGIQHDGRHIHPVHQGWDAQLGTANWGHPNGSYNAPLFKNSDVYKNIKEAT